MAQLVADLSDSTAAKKALFTIKDMLMTADFARAFVEAGGYQELLRACLKAEGNTLAYGLSALHICLQHYRETDADKHPVALEQQLMLSLSKQFEAVHTGVSKGTLEVFIQLNRRRKVNVYDILRQSHTGEPPCAALVRLLSHADVDCHQRALTLINAVVSGFQQQPLAAKLELYSELSRIGIYEQFGVLRSTTDVMVRTQLCAYQITRFGVTRERMSTPYDKANAEHEAALLRLWQLTFPDVALENRISSQWSKVGFQGTDPATDFRGFGVLGLDAMLYFAGQHTDEWRGVITRNEARAEREYPVATAVINACKLVNDLFHLADGTSAQNDLLSPLALSDSTFEAIVHVAMLIIDRLWDDMNASYMQFPAVIAAAKAELESGASLYISLDEWRAALRRGEKAPVKGSSTGHGAEKSKKSSAAVAFLKRVNIGGGGGGGGGGNAPPPAAPPKPAPMPRPMSARKNTAESGGEVERLKAQLARAQEELAVLRKVQPATNGSTPAAQLSPTLAARNARNLDEIPIGEVFLDEECAHSGRVGGVYYGTWFADRVAVRIFGSNHEELAGKWRRGEPQPSVNADARLACRRELQRLLAAVHPNVCLVIGSIKGAPAVMYELHTCDLRSYLHQFNFTREQRLFLALDAARGISFLHRRSPPIVVGNISTPHFLVDTAGSVRVASLYNDPQQITSKGAPNLGDVALAANITSWCRDAVWNIDAAFAAPEVFARGSLTTASDTFAFGVLLSEVLTGNAPWADATTSQIIQHVLHQDRLPFVAAAAATAGGAGDEDESIVQQLLLGCTHRLPQSRPAMVDVSLLLFEHVSATSTEDD